MAQRGFHFLLLNEDIQGKHWEEDVGLFDLALKNSFNYLVLNMYRQWENFSLSTGHSYSLTYLQEFKSMFNTYQKVTTH